ncbi:hypothetical protein LTR84_005999 [Exophiala bonariae]|uniref:Enoyl reductase (ER) domain-containing protein n=1 Tax=Exophiala bonariae TaxID=1690606 RepID=A0AAV9N6J3_9EURO|nr:hypothetical protein LTR84_005999 [Exophiala bonariae]
MAPMAMATRAIVCRSPQNGKRQWGIENVEVDYPEADEVLVRIVASGVCHTDLGCGSHPDGVGFPTPPYPRVLGHEGAGYVEKIGSSVSTVKPGDAVLLSFAFCRECHNCKHGAPGYCSRFTPLNFSGDTKAFNLPGIENGTVGGSFFGQSSFSNLTRVQETSLVKVTELIENEDDLKLYAPLGCGIQTGAGTITELGAARASDKVAIIGLGGVGLAAIMAAKHRGCQTIIGIDRVEARLELSKKLGATHTINTSVIKESLEKAVRDLTEQSGTTITVDATGVVPLIQQGMDFTANQGKMILLGVAPMDASLQVPLVSFMVSGKQLLGSMEGAVRPIDYIPRMIQWHRQGDFPIDKLVRFYQAQGHVMATQTIRGISAAGIPTTMRAWQFSTTRGGIEKNLRLNESAPVPAHDAHALGHDKVLVKIIAAGINPVDYKLAELPIIGRFLYRKNATPGSDFAGVIAAATPAVAPGQRNGFREGQLVFGRLSQPVPHGTFEEYVVLKSADIAHVPEGVDPVDAAGVGVAGLTAYQCIQPFVRAGRGDRVFINGGSGGTGVWGIQIAKALGCHVTTSCSGTNAEFCKSLGADEVIDYRSTNIVDALKKSVSGADGQKFALAVDNVGGQGELYWQSHHYLSPGARYIQIGAEPGLGPVLDLVMKLTWPGFLGGGKRKFEMLTTKNNTEQMEEIGKLLQQRRVKAVFHDGTVLSMEDGALAFAKLKTHRAKGKIVIKVSSD